MRPKRLEVEGFTAFREHTVVDFDGADLFAFTGPTGSGKSSLVDAMGFALYGRVHRYGEKLVHAAISSGATEVRVRLDFTVSTTEYTAVRVARRTGPGRATTKEARLERSGEVVAGDEKGLTAAVEDLLGLDFEQYCRCVVLPQGAFAAFLHDTPKGRQDLLTGLLDLGFYREMAQLAGQRAATAAAKAAALDDRLGGDLADATPEALAAAGDRVRALDALAARLAETAPRIEDVARRAREAQAEADGATARVTALDSVWAPAGLDRLGAQLAAASDRLAEATKAAEEAEALVAARAVARQQQGDRQPLDAARLAHRRRAELGAHREQAVTAQQRTAGELAAAKMTAERAEAERLAADAAVEASRQANRAHALVVDLVAGEPCPVCRQAVHDIPPIEEPPDYTAARAAAEAAAGRAREAADRLRAAAAAEARAGGELAAIDAQMGDVEAELAGRPDAGDVETRIAAIEEAETALATARQAEQTARMQLRQAAAAEREARDGERQARVHFEAERDRLASLGPPAPARVDLATDWQQLASWAVAAKAEAEAARDAALDDARARQAEHSSLVDEVATWCAGEGVTVGGRPPGEAVAAARADAEARRAVLEARVAEVERVGSELERVRGDEQVARTLALHLRSDHFEKWLLDEAVEELTASATALLRELSGGAYSLTLDPKSRDFAVVDHRNADDARPVRTLSGGETFLASLALALALADRVADLSSAGAARLEALFLDEGFGTLDPETLDTVAAAIEHLGAGGRMVGIVTHVRELAERVPMRFEVTKGARTATVQKVLS